MTPPPAEAKPDHAQWFSPLGSSASRIMPGATPSLTSMRSASSNGSRSVGTPAGNPFGKPVSEEPQASLPGSAACRVTGDGRHEQAQVGQDAADRHGLRKERGTFWSTHPELSSSNHGPPPEGAPAVAPASRPIRQGRQEAQDATNGHTGSTVSVGSQQRTDAAHPTGGVSDAGAAQAAAAGGHPWPPVSIGAPPAAAAGAVVADTAVDVQQRQRFAERPACSMGDGGSMAGALQHAQHSCMPATAPAMGNLQAEVTTLSQQVCAVSSDLLEVQMCNELAATLVCACNCSWRLKGAAGGMLSGSCRRLPGQKSACWLSSGAFRAS